MNQIAEKEPTMWETKAAVLATTFNRLRELNPQTRIVLQGWVLTIWAPGQMQVSVPMPMEVRGRAVFDTDDIIQVLDTGLQIFPNRCDGDELLDWRYFDARLNGEESQYPETWFGSSKEYAVEPVLDLPFTIQEMALLATQKEKDGYSRGNVIGIPVEPVAGLEIDARLLLALDSLIIQDADDTALYCFQNMDNLKVTPMIWFMYQDMMVEMLLKEN